MSITPALNVSVSLFQNWNLLYLLPGFLITVTTIPIIIFLAHKYNLLYVPNHRTVHVNPIPAMGGIGIYFGFVIAFLLINRNSFPANLTLVISVTLLFFLGLIDDLKEISAKQKFLFSILISIILLSTPEFRIHNLNGFMNIYLLPDWISVALSFFILIFIINAFNLIDGIDGLAGGIGILSLSIFSMIAYNYGDETILGITLPMIVALSGFLIYNLWGNRNKIFMGDSGSLITGLIIAVTCIKLFTLRDNSYVHAATVSPVTMFSVLIIPAFDTIHVFFVRVLQGKSPFKPDRNHFHHTYLKLGLSHKKTTLVFLSYTLLMFLISQFLLLVFSEIASLSIVITLCLILWHSSEIILKRNLRKYSINLNEYKRRPSFANISKNKEHQESENYPRIPEKIHA